MDISPVELLGSKIADEIEIEVQNMRSSTNRHAAGYSLVE
jgi:hypothetical protein